MIRHIVTRVWFSKPKETNITVSPQLSIKNIIKHCYPIIQQNWLEGHHIELFDLPNVQA
jgi:hypothetical protein